LTKFWYFNVIDAAFSDGTAPTTNFVGHFDLSTATFAAALAAEDVVQVYFLVNAIYVQTSVPDFFLSSEDLHASPFLIDGTDCALTVDVAAVKAIAATNAAAAITRLPAKPRLFAVFMIFLSSEE